MHIGFVTTEYITEENFDGGQANYLYKITQALKNIGHEPFVVVTSKNEECIEYHGVKVYRVKAKPVFLYKLLDVLTRFKCQRILDYGLESYFMYQKIRQIHATKPIDLIQYASFRATSFFSPSSIPYVVRLSSFEKFINQANGIINKSIIQKQGEIIDEISIRKAKMLFAPSQFLARHVSKKTGKPISVIETPFFPRVLQEDPKIVAEIRRMTNGKPYFLFFGRLALFKGVVDIADILEVFFKKYPDFYMVFVGKDLLYKGQPTINYVYDKAGPFREQVIYQPQLSHEELYPVIREAFAVLLPSRIENISNACIEALSLGKVVIATKGVSFEELITDGHTGILCENASPASLLEAIERVIQLPADEKVKMERNAAASVERLKPEVTVKKIESFYLSILNRQ